MLQHHQPNYDLGWRSHPATRRALGMSMLQCFVDGVDEIFVVENFVSLLHPRLPPILNWLAKETFRDLSLTVVSFDHERQSRRSSANFGPPTSTKNDERTRCLSHRARLCYLSAVIFAPQSN